MIELRQVTSALFRVCQLNTTRSTVRAWHVPQLRPKNRMRRSQKTEHLQRHAYIPYGMARQRLLTRRRAQLVRSHIGSAKLCCRHWVDYCKCQYQRVKVPSAMSSWSHSICGWGPSLLCNQSFKRLRWNRSVNFQCTDEG